MKTVSKIIGALLLSITLLSATTAEEAHSTIISATGAISARAFGFGSHSGSAPPPTVVATNIGSATGLAATVSITVPMGGVPAGSAVYVLVNEADLGGGAMVNGTVTDNAGTPNSYTELTGGVVDLLTNRLMIFQAFNVNAISAGDTITYTLVNALNDADITAFYVTGLTASNPFDSATLNTSTFLDANPSPLLSGAPSVPNEFFIAATGYGSYNTIGDPNFILDTTNGWTEPPPTKQNSAQQGQYANGIAGGLQQNSGSGMLTMHPTFSMTSTIAGGMAIIGLKPL